MRAEATAAPAAARDLAAGCSEESTCLRGHLLLYSVHLARSKRFRCVVLMIGAQLLQLYADKLILSYEADRHILLHPITLSEDDKVMGMAHHTE